MNWLAAQCMLAYGWRRGLLALGAGAVAGLSMPPLFALPALFLALPVWVWLLDGAESVPGWRGRLFGPAFRIGLGFGLGYFLIALHWIGAAFFVDGGWLLWLMPFAVLALSAGMALFWGLASAAAHWLWTPSGWRIVTLATTLTIAEFGRGHVLTGFPFDLVGYALTANEQMMQSASLFGVYGLTFVAILIAQTPALVWPAEERGLNQRLAPFFGALGVIALMIGYGEVRLRTNEIADRPDMRLRLVQPAIDQATKWQAESRDFVLERLISLSQTVTGPADSGLVGKTHLIWPEAALPFFLSDYPEALARFARMLPPETLLITGAPRNDTLGADTGPDFNAVLAIDSDGEVVATYDKTHLVPVGEFLPFGEIWRSLGLRQFVPGAEGWTHGGARRLLAPGGTPGFLPLICYEIIFSGDLGMMVDDAVFMLNLTNDGWFDGSVGPAQHFHHARLRAVEHGVPLVRVANTGITALVDPFGRITARTSEGEVAVLDVSMPERLQPTLFSRYSHWPLLAVLAAGILFSVISRWRFRRRRRPAAGPSGI